MPQRTGGRSERLRARLVQDLVAGERLRSEPARRAFSRVHREDFVPEIARMRGLDAVYDDAALVIAERDGVPTSSSSQPSIMALMLEGLDLHPGLRVLEVGLGSGYNAALLSEIVGPSGTVTSVDNNADLVETSTARLADAGYPVRTGCGDGRDGWPPDAPYDRMIITASSDRVPYGWWQQLDPGGLLLLPLRIGVLQSVVALVRTDDGFASERVIPGGFMPLRDAGSGANPTASLMARVAIPGEPAVEVTVSGPGVAALSRAARRRLLGHLAEPPTVTPVEPQPAWPALWQLALVIDSDHQVSLNRAGQLQHRVGIIDPETGDCAAMAAGPRPSTGDQTDPNSWVTTALETYVGGSVLTARLQSVIRDEPRRSLSDLRIVVEYGDGPPSTDAVRSVDNGDHRILLGWQPTHGG